MAELRVERVDETPDALVQLRVPMNLREQAARRLGLPTRPSTWSGSDPEALWLGPDRWLLVGRGGDAAALVERCRSMLDGVLHVACDATSALSLFRIEGDAAVELLAMGSGVDFDPAVFGDQGCVRTRWMQATVIVRRTAAAAYEMYVDATLADHVAHWIEHSRADAISVRASRNKGA